jgi:hypothetical protein
MYGTWGTDFLSCRGVQKTLATPLEMSVQNKNISYIQIKQWKYAQLKYKSQINYNTNRHRQATDSEYMKLGGRLMLYCPCNGKSGHTPEADNLFKIAPKHCFLQIHGTAILKKKVVV